MKIIIGKTAGFCYGVKRAVEGCQEEVNKKQKTYCLGEIVHNKQVVENLEKQGIKFIEKIEDINSNELENSKLIIRAHGVDKKIYEIAQNKKIEVLDYTCPNVLKIHKIAKEYQEKGYYIFLTGTQNHPEIVGTVSYCGDNYSIITKKEDIKEEIKKLIDLNIRKLLILSQTTYSIEKFKEIEKEIKEKIPSDFDVIVKNTICLATELRQKEVNELSLKVDYMIIVGGKNSSNTKKLYEIAKKNCKNTICIETKNELEESEILNEEVNTIGIMAGASTPQKSIDEVEEWVKERKNK